MVEQRDIVQAFVKLGNLLGEYCENRKHLDSEKQSFLSAAIDSAQRLNGWFTEDNIRFALRQWGSVLTKENLERWLSAYDIPNTKESRTIAIIMAGNIPLVGFHDFVSVLLTGHKAICKLSSNDTVLLPCLVELLAGFEPKLKEQITITEGKLGNFDAVIATGSNNTSRYFEYYFSRKPHIIRKNRTSVAVLNGSENQNQLKALGEDVFRYFGLGCRNVSKLFVPTGYNFDGFFKAIYDFKEVINHHKYANNYDYNKAVYLMSEFKILDNGFLILKEDKNLHSPISVLFYEEYDSLQNLNKRLGEERDMLQCVVSGQSTEGNSDFGRTQQPTLADYADGVDTVEFLLKL